jgi:hypothetical protein
MNMPLTSWIRPFFFLTIFLSAPLIGHGQTCNVNLKITYPDGEKGCLTDLPISTFEDKTWGKKFSELVKYAGYYSIASASNCPNITIGVTGIKLEGRGGGNPKEITESEALKQCPKSCDCSIVIQNGNVLIPKSSAYLLSSKDPNNNPFLALEQSKREKAAVEKQKFLNEFNKYKNESDWVSRLNLTIGSLLQSWMDEASPQSLPEVSPPEFPPALKLTQEIWETNKEFEERIRVSRVERQREIERIQSEYKANVNKRNFEIQKLTLARAEKEKQLQNKKKEFLSAGLEALDLNAEIKKVSFDQSLGSLLVDVSVENGPITRYSFKDTPIEIRREAMLTVRSLSLKPDFFINDSGQFGIKSMTIESKGAKVTGMVSEINPTSQVLKLATNDIQVPKIPLLTQQATTTVDKNQVEQISYREENESLRKRLEEQRRSQELALAEEIRKVATETAKLRVEAEAAKSRQRELELQLASARTPINYGKALNAHALIIGNASYGGSAKLPNPINDAKAMSGVLRGLGFTVTESLDADRTKLVTALSQFSRIAANADITLLFYAGHGVQISGTNYMLPVDLNLNDLSQVPLQGVSLNSVVEQYLPGKTKLVFLDACRDNPLMQTASRSVSRGLAPINVSEGTLISYSTKDGQVAQDGDGKNSPFTTALLQHLGDPDDIAVVLRKVREDVLKNTNGKQQPWEYGSLTGGALVLSAIKPIK